jgi:hypothetical protein
LIKGRNQQEEITLGNIHNKYPHTGFIKQTLLGIKTQIDPSLLIVGHVHTPFSPIGHLDRSSVRKPELNETTGIMNLRITLNSYITSKQDSFFL